MFCITFPVHANRHGAVCGLIYVRVMPPKSWKWYGAAAVAALHSVGLEWGWHPVGVGRPASARVVGCLCCAMKMCPWLHFGHANGLFGFPPVPLFL